MPVVVSYMPRQSRPGYDPRQQEEGDDLFLRGQQINNQRDYQRSQLQAQNREQRVQDDFRQQQLGQSADEFQQEQDLRTREQDFREQHADDMEAATAPNQTIADSQGRQYQGTRAQAAAVGNLNAMGALDDDSLRGALGLPEPMVDYETPTGEVVKVRRSQLPALQQKDAAQQGKDESTIVREQQNKAAMQQKAAAHGDLITYQNERLDLERQRYLTTDAKEQAAIDQKLQANQKYMQAGTEKAAAAEVTQARHSVDDYIKAKGFVPINDPQLQTLQQAVTQAMAAEKKIIETGRAAATQPAPKTATNAPGRNTPSATPTGGANASQGSGAKASRPIYSHTATGPDGSKIGFNTETKQWEPIQP